MVSEFILQRLARLLSPAKSDESDHSLSLDLVGTTYHGCLGNGMMTDQGTLEFRSTQTMTRNIQNVVDATNNPEVPLLVTARSVTREVGSFDLAPVLMAIACLVPPYAAQHGRPRLTNDQLATLAMRNFNTIVIDNGGVDSEERERGGSGLARCGTGNGGDHVGTGFRLPPGIDDGASLVTDVLIEPHPCFRIDRLTNCSQKTQRGEVVLARMIIPPLHEGANRRRGGVEDRDTVVGDELPEAVRFGPVRGSLIHEAGRSIGKRAVDEVAVTGDPPDVCRAPVNVILTKVEDIFGGGIGSHEIAAGGVQDTLRFAG